MLLNLPALIIAPTIWNSSKEVGMTLVEILLDADFTTLLLLLRLLLSTALTLDHLEITYVELGVKFTVI